MLNILFGKRENYGIRKTALGKTVKKNTLLNENNL